MNCPNCGRELDAVIGGDVCTCTDASGKRTAPQMLRFAQLALNSMQKITRYVIPLPDGKKPYLERLVLDRDGPHGAGTYLHVIYESDGDRDPHDHPFNFTSTIIHGSYRERGYTLQCPGEWCSGRVQGRCCALCGRLGVPRVTTNVVFKAGDVNIKHAAELHKLELIDGPVVTLVKRGPKLRSWGFQTEDGWEHHSDYIVRKFPHAVTTEVE